MSKFFETFEPKDWVTLLASISALFFSIITYRQKIKETENAFRKQLTEILEKLSNLNTEISKYRSS